VIPWDFQGYTKNYKKLIQEKFFYQEIGNLKQKKVDEYE
jgi:hypothetical protein